MFRRWVFCDMCLFGWWYVYLEGKDEGLDGILGMDHSLMALCHHRWRRRRDNSPHRRRTAHTKPPRRRNFTCTSNFLPNNLTTVPSYITQSTHNQLSYQSSNTQSALHQDCSTFIPISVSREPLLMKSITLHNLPSSPTSHAPRRKYFIKKSHNISNPSSPSELLDECQPFNSSGANQEMSITRTGHWGGHVKWVWYGTIRDLRNIKQQSIAPRNPICKVQHISPLSGINTRPKYLSHPKLPP